MSVLLESVHASAIADIKFHTLELLSDDLPDGGYRWVQGFNDESLGLESGEMVTFTGMPFGVSLAEKSLRGNQDIQFQLDNVTGEALQAIKLVLNGGEKMAVIYRCYLDSDHSAPAQSATEMTATGFSANYQSVNIIADFHDFVNRKWPTRRYITDLAPGLKYL